MVSLSIVAGLSPCDSCDPRARFNALAFFSVRARWGGGGGKVGGSLGRMVSLRSLNPYSV